MKTTYVIRHAKSSWKDMNLEDIERPLNKRGLRDAPFMARLFASKELTPQVIYSSPAVRAYATATCFAEALGIPARDIQMDGRLYLCDEEYVLQKIRHSPENADTLCFFGHNPTTTHLANIFHKEYIPNVPTCAIVKVQADVDTWQRFTLQTASFVTMHYPKQYFV